jgi:hypothetical protein
MISGAEYVGNEGRRDDYKPCFIYIFPFACRTGGEDGEATNGTLARLFLDSWNWKRQAFSLA